MTENKAPAAIMVVSNLYSNIMGMLPTIIANHNVLKALTYKSVLEGRLTRLADFLMGYDLNIVYCRVKDKAIASTLSSPIISQEWKEMHTAAKSNIITAQLLNRIYIPMEQ